MSALTDAHIEGQSRLRQAIVSYLTALWRSYAAYDEPQADEFSQHAATAVVAAQRASVALTDAYVGQHLGTGPIGVNADAVIAALRGDTTPEQVYRRPFVTVWTALQDGRPWQDAVNSGLARATSTGEMDVQMASWGAFDDAQQRDPRIKGYRRKADSGACAYCRKIDGAFVKSASASPLHNRCGCSLSPELQEHPVTPLPDGVAVHEHGELGAVLTDPAHDFTKQLGGAPTDDLARDAKALRDRVLPPTHAELEAIGSKVRQRADASTPGSVRLDAARVELVDVERRITAAIEDSAADRITVDEAFARMGPLRDTRAKLEKEIADLAKDAHQRRVKAILDELRRVRPGYGTGRIGNAAGSQSGVNLLHKSAEHLPKEWIDASNKSGEIAVNVGKGRGLHRWRRGGSEIDLRPDDVPLAIHELTHRMQRVVPKIRDAERSLYTARVTNAKGKIEKADRIDHLTGGFGYESNEVSRGAWTEHYIGKDYATALDRKSGVETDPLEVLTMALEGIFGDRYHLFGGQGMSPGERQLGDLVAGKPTATQKRLLEKFRRHHELRRTGDRELVDFALGVLASL